MEIKALRGCRLRAGQVLRPGEIADIGAGLAVRLITAGKAERVYRTTPADEVEVEVTAATPGELPEGDQVVGVAAGSGGEAPERPRTQRKTRGR